MIWSTTSYTRTPDGLVEAHRDLGPDELPAAVYAVEASDNNGRSYSANGLRWADIDDAKTWASGLAMRWFGCTNIRVVRVTPPRIAGDVTLDESADRALQRWGVTYEDHLDIIDQPCANGHFDDARTPGGPCFSEAIAAAAATIAAEYAVIDVVYQTL